MGMWTTDNQDTMSLVLKAFSEAARKNYGTHAFEAGYLQSVIISVLPNLPKRQQKILIDDMVRATQKQEQEVIKKMRENHTLDRVSV
jgi:hypothetical protein